MDPTPVQTSTTMPLYRIYVGSYTHEISTLLFDPQDRRVILQNCVTVGFHPSWIVFHPTDPSIVFAGLEKPEGEVVAVRFDENGQGTVLGRVKSGGHSPCALLATPDEILVGNYMGGTLGAIPLASDAPELLRDEVWTKKFDFTAPGPNKVRQEAPHPHQVVLHPDRAELLVPDLGNDKTWRMAKGEDGRWEVKGAVEYKAGSGPRHVAIHKDTLYTVLELTSEVAVHRFPPLPTPPTHLATLPTMQKFPGPIAELGMLAAEILIPPSNSKYPTPYMYVSNRNDPSESDVIAIFDVSDPENVRRVAEVPSGLKHLRGMIVAGPDDQYLVAGGANGHGVKIFERTEGGKALSVVAGVDLMAPTAFLWQKIA